MIHRPLRFHQLATNTRIRPYHDLCLMLACPGIVLLEVYSVRKPAEHVPKFCLRYVMLLERIWCKHIFPAPACITLHLAYHLVQSSSKALPMAFMQHKTGFIQMLCA